MKKVFILFLGSLLITISGCNDLEEIPPIDAGSDSLEDYTGVLNAAYYYQLGIATPIAVMGDFRADNAIMDEEPYPEFDRFTPNLTVMEDQFFGPFFTASYRCILSANNVILNSDDAVQIGEAKFLRALTYFKMVQVFGDVPVILETADIGVILGFDLTRQPAADVYNNVVVPDLQDAIATLGNAEISSGRASSLAAQALLGKVYMHRGDFINAEPLLGAVANNSILGLQENYGDIVAVNNELNAEVIFAHQRSASITDEYGFSEFDEWFFGLDTKALEPLDTDLIAAFDAVDGEVIDAAAGDLRRAVVIDETALASPKYTQADGPEYDLIEIRLADVILLYAEALNENGASPATVLPLLDDIRERAGLNNLDPSTLNTQELVRQAIADERRLELAFEGHRWFDLVRTGTVDAEMGETVDPNYYLFPIPISEVLASDGVITQNPGY